MGDEAQCRTRLDHIPLPFGRGAVVTLECVEKLIRKDMVDPVSGQQLTERDIIVLQRVRAHPALPEAPPFPRMPRPSREAPPFP